MQVTAPVLLFLTSFGPASLQRLPGTTESPTISANGWPPRIFVTWKTTAPQEAMSPLTYDVICCTRRYKICSSAFKSLPNVFNTSVLQRAPWCQRKSIHPGITFQCNVTGVWTSQLNQRDFYAVIKVSNHLGANYSSYGFLDLNENSKCTQPTGFTGVVSARRSVNLTWFRPLYMGVRTPYLKYGVFYVAHANKCSTVGNQTQTLEHCQDVNLFSCVVSGLLPDTSYTFYVACVTTYLNSGWKWGESAVFNFTTSKEAPSVSPTKVERLGSDVTFSKKRNITVQWQAPSCPTEWGTEPERFIINYWPSNTSVVLQTSGEQRNSSLAGSLETTNTSSRSAVIGYLERYSSYLVTVKMCTAVGCGPESAAAYFEAEEEIPKPSQPPTFTDKPTDGSGMIIVSVIAVIGATLVAVAMVRCFLTRRSNHPPEEPLPRLHGRIHDVCPENLKMLPRARALSDEGSYNYPDDPGGSWTSLSGL